MFKHKSINFIVVVQQLNLPGKYFKVTDCNVEAVIDGKECEFINETSWLKEKTSNLDSFPILSNGIGNHLVAFRFEGENQDTRQIAMSFKTFYFKNGSGNQSITCKVETCDGKCDEGRIHFSMKKDKNHQNFPEKLNCF